MGKTSVLDCGGGCLFGTVFSCRLAGWGVEGISEMVAISAFGGGVVHAAVDGVVGSSCGGEVWRGGVGKGEGGI